MITVLLTLTRTSHTQALNLSLSPQPSYKAILGPTTIERAEIQRVALEAEKAKEAERVRLIEKARTDALWAAHPAGNDYYIGQCVWYVANKRPVPYGLGNANTWYTRAKAWGFDGGAEPRVGAVATTTAYYYGHVAYVEAVYGDGRILVSEMNYQGWNFVNTRVTLATDWLYIY